MADNKKKTGKADDIRVAGKQDYEVAYVAKKAGVKKSVAQKAVDATGPMRKSVEAELRKKKK